MGRHNYQELYLGVGGVAKTVEYPPSKWETLSSVKPQFYQKRRIIFLKTIE
jgi:hypothetical protein